MADWSTNAQINTFKRCLDCTKSMRGLCFNSTTLTYNDLLTFLHYKDTENVTTMYAAFSGCTSLTTIPLIDTSNVTNMEATFQSCSNLTTIPLLNTSNVTTMFQTFVSCSSLTSIPQLDTSSVTNMGNMFQGCTLLTTIPLLDTSEVTNMLGTFRYCGSLISIPALDVSKASFNNYTVGNCINLREIHMINIKNNLNISPSNKFTREALVEILGNLVDVGASRTLTMGADNYAKLTADDIAIATAKGWTIA